MKRLCLPLVAAMIVAANVLTLRHYRQELRRLQGNQAALTAQVDHYRTRAGSEAAAAEALRLRCAEFEALRADDAARIRALGIRIRRLEAAATVATVQEAAFTTPLHDTILLRERDTLRRADTLHSFRWSDPWCRVEGVAGADSVHCRIACIDTLRQIVHRVPRKFLFIRWGTKALRQEIVASNPHTRIVYAEYVQITR